MARKKGFVSEINVTPFVDVMLVLLIIASVVFIVVVGKTVYESLTTKKDLVALYRKSL